MQLYPGQLIRVTCGSIVKFPHDGIVSKTTSGVQTSQDVCVIHFCRADPAQLFCDGAADQAPETLVVRETMLSWFLASGTDAIVVAGPPSPFMPNEVVRRARSKLGAAEYKLHKRNCQSFATHCYNGKAFSEAVESAGQIIAGALVVLAVAVYLAAKQFASTPWA